MIILSMLMTLSKEFPSRFNITRDDGDFTRPRFWDSKMGFDFGPNCPEFNDWLILMLGESRLHTVAKHEAMTWQESLLNAVVCDMCSKKEVSE